MKRIERTFPPASALRGTPCSSQAIEKDAIDGESCYQEDGEEVRREKGRAKGCG
jgi:hypothetical protein